jgi:hypothetical protein
MLPVRIISLLVPADDLSVPPPSVAGLIENGRLHGLVLDDGREIVRLDDLMPPMLEP